MFNSHWSLRGSENYYYIIMQPKWIYFLKSISSLNVKLLMQFYNRVQKLADWYLLDIMYHWLRLVKLPTRAKNLANVNWVIRSSSLLPSIPVQCYKWLPVIQLLSIVIFPASFQQEASVAPIPGSPAAFCFHPNEKDVVRLISGRIGLLQKCEFE